MTEVNPINRRMARCRVAGRRNQHLVGYLGRSRGARACDADDTLVAATTGTAPAAVAPRQPARDRHGQPRAGDTAPSWTRWTAHQSARRGTASRAMFASVASTSSEVRASPASARNRWTASTRFCAVVSCQTLTAYTTLPAVSVTGEERTIDQAPSPVFWMRKRRGNGGLGLALERLAGPASSRIENDWPFSSKRANCLRTSVTGAARSSAALANPSACAPRRLRRQAAPWDPGR